MSNIITREITYQDSEGQQLIGYFAYPQDVVGPLPAILVCPEWWGRNQYIDSRAYELAEHGYAALAVDMYGDKKLANTVEDAKALMMSTFDAPDTIVDRLTAALNILIDQPEVNADKIAAIGFCYGGKIALDLARSGADLKVVATFHASLAGQAKAQATQFHPEVLVAHGADDSMVPIDEVKQFEQEMQDAGATYHIEVYPRAKHGFTNPSADEKAEKYDIDLGYNPLVASESFDAMYALLARKLK